MQVTIALYGKDGVTPHGMGEVDIYKIADASLIIRNRHYYRFQGTVHSQPYKFVECDQPVIITEF